MEKYQFALTAFEKAYSLDSEWVTTQYFLGVSHKELKHLNDSIFYFNLALSNDFEPKLAIYKELADLYFQNKDYKKSAEAYEKVLEINKSDVNAFIRPIWLYLDFVKDPKKALKLSKIAFASFPESAMTYNLLGWSYIGTKDYDQAEKNLKKSIEMDNTLSAAHYNLARLYQEKNKYDLALKYYQEAYKLDVNGSIGNLSAKAYNELLKETLSN